MQDNKTCVWKHTVKDRKSLRSISTSKQSHTWELCAKGRPREVVSVAFCTFCGFNLLFFLPRKVVAIRLCLVMLLLFWLQQTVLQENRRTVWSKAPIKFIRKCQYSFQVRDRKCLGFFATCTKAASHAVLQGPYNKLLRKHSTFFILLISDCEKS